MAIDFPAGTTVGQVFNGPGGVQYVWDGVKWVVASAAGPPVAGAAGTVTSVGSGTGLSGGPITTAGTLSLANTAVAAGSYTNTNLTVDAQGRITAASNGSAGGGGSGTVDVGRNFLHNSQFNIRQRGNGPFTTIVYTADRWRVLTISDTISVTFSAPSAQNITDIGDESVANLFVNVFTGASTGGTYNRVEQLIEDVRRLAGKTVTVSFWANSDSGLKIGINGVQSFGSGGASNSFLLNTGLSITTTAAFQRFSVTFAVPSIAGKTVGTGGDSYTALWLFFSSGSGNNQIAGNIGVQSGTVRLWGMQLEIGSAATALEKIDPQQDLAKCQRFYFVQQAIGVNFYAGTTSSNNTYLIPFPVTMRAIPTATPTFSGQSNTFTGYPQMTNIRTHCAQISTFPTAVGDVSFAVNNINFSADL